MSVALAEVVAMTKATSKLHYVTLRLFRNLLSKGYCSDDVQEGGSAEDGDGNRNFEDDVDGTGMGEGDGKKDVSDEIEDEEQILGLEGTIGRV